MHNLCPHVRALQCVLIGHVRVSISPVTERPVVVIFYHLVIFCFDDVSGYESVSAARFFQRQQVWFLRHTT